MFKAEKQDGSTEQVEVLFPMTAQINELATSVGDADRLIEIFCERPRGWANSLTRCSRMELFRELLRVTTEYTDSFMTFRVGLSKTSGELIAGIKKEIEREHPDGRNQLQ